MHGRLKVRTSAEEAARKKKEQELKANAYKAGMGKIFEKRELDQLDTEMMELTGKILCGNPDIYTLWNIRKECLLKLTEADKDNVILFEKDLGFTENCLQVNPKSYGAWHHRCWILENSPEPNYKREVDLCTKYLKMDERNFHCWDYRRYVVEKANISPEKEFEFCTQKIQHNFSNYSSWHYRSKLLPLLYPHPTDKTRPICEEKLREELELVLTAAFTDPKDSSAWFYQRWLLGYSEPELDIAAFSLSDELAMIAFTKPINLRKCKILVNFCSNLEVDNWNPPSKNNICDTTWIIERKLFDTKIIDQIDEVTVIDEQNNEHKLIIKKTGNSFYGIKTPKFEYVFGEAVVEELKNQLNSCNQLLEYEPDSKWTLLTAALLMRAIDRKTYHPKALRYLEKLQKVDKLRQGYYRDLTSKWSTELVIEKWIENGDWSAPVDLSNLNLTTLYYEQYLSLASNVNLSNNYLCDRNLAKLSALQNCKMLNLSENYVTTIAAVPPLAKIEKLCLLFQKN